MSRSEFFCRAASRYLDDLDAESITRQIDQSIDAQPGNDDSANDAVAVGRRVLDDLDDDW